MLILVLCFASATSYAEEAQKEYLYTVKPGDNLSTFSQNILDTSKRWPEVAKYNKLKNPQVITPGQVLRIQLTWLKSVPAEAVIESVQGAVTLNGQPANVGDKVATGAKLETPAGASVRMSLPDGSTLSMLEKTKFEAMQLDKKPQGNFFTAVFRLVTGRIDAIKKKYPGGQAPLRIKAMHGTIGVRGTHFRMGQEQGNTFAEIENGLVSFGDDAVAQPIALSAAEGSVGDGVHAPAVIPLLPAPRFPDFPTDFPPQLMSFTMPELAGAKAYRGELAADENFAQMIAPVSADSAEIKITGLAEGKYWLRLRAVDEHGLQGMPAQILITVKIQPAVAPPPEPANFSVITPYKPIMSGRQMLTGWSHVQGYEYEWQLANQIDFSQPLMSVRTKDNYLNFNTPTAGAYYIRLRLLDHMNRVGAWCEPVAFVAQ